VVKIKLSHRKTGFTLIELLIVVAIIAILAAIAIPNFLQAQVRGKVARSKAELRSIATGMEAYYVDENSYPIYSATNFHNVGLIRLTSPISYMASVPMDQFKYRGNWIGGNGAPGWYWAYTDSNDFTAGQPMPIPKAYVIWSNGPDLCNQLPGFKSQSDLENNVGILPPQTVTSWGFGGGAFTYDPTNGTISLGDIWYASR
jgi:prepilin-type N-terminal cleavage/methylation domain-containing protein